MLDGIGGAGKAPAASSEPNAGPEIKKTIQKRLTKYVQSKKSSNNNGFADVVYWAFSARARRAFEDFFPLQLSGSAYFWFGAVYSKRADMKKRAHNESKLMNDGDENVMAATWAGAT